MSQVIDLAFEPGTLCGVNQETCSWSVGRPFLSSARLKQLIASDDMQSQLHSVKPECGRAFPERILHWNHRVLVFAHLAAKSWELNGLQNQAAVVPK
jgi:hypothetical protein